MQLNGMKVVIFGATGMVGKGVLLECLDDARIERVLLVSRQPVDVTHPKVLDVVHQNFFDFGSIQSRFVDLDACFFCLGVSSVGVRESEYHHLTYELTLAAATALAAATDRRFTFCYVSENDTDTQSWTHRVGTHQGEDGERTATTAFQKQRSCSGRATFSR